MRSMVEGRRRPALRTINPSVTTRSRAATPPHSLREQGGDGIVVTLPAKL